MSPYRFLLPALVLVFMATARDAWPDEPTQIDQQLTPELAKSALLEMMRSESGQDLRWFQGNVPDEMEDYPVEQEDDGWYTWTRAFRFHPGDGTYTLTVAPQEDSPLCTFEYQGRFELMDGRWTATLPELVSVLTPQRN